MQVFGSFTQLLYRREKQTVGKNPAGSTLPADVRGKGVYYNGCNITKNSFTDHAGPGITGRTIWMDIAYECRATYAPQPHPDGFCVSAAAIQLSGIGEARGMRLVARVCAHHQGSPGSPWTCV